MCLNLMGKETINKRLLGKLNSKGLYSGYKAFNKFDGLINSLYYGHHWRHGWNESTRICKYITLNEKAIEQVNLGFHIFLNKQDALDMIPDGCTIICRKVYFKLDDVIATGTWGEGDELCAVVKKLFVRFD